MFYTVTKFPVSNPNLMIACTAPPLPFKKKIDFGFGFQFQSQERKDQGEVATVPRNLSYERRKGRGRELEAGVCSASERDWGVAGIGLGSGVAGIGLDSGVAGIGLDSGVEGIGLDSGVEGIGLASGVEGIGLV